MATETKHPDCPACNGDGYIERDRETDSGPETVAYDCELCDGLREFRPLRDIVGCVKSDRLARLLLELDECISCGDWAAYRECLLAYQRGNS